MCKKKYTYAVWERLLLIITILSLCDVVYPQQLHVNDSIKRIPPEIINKITEFISRYSKQAILSMPVSMIPATISIKDQNISFLDSLKVKASKNQLTRRLYDIVVIRRDTIDKNHFSRISDANYSAFSGKKIRKIIIQRLNVFGADINNPSSVRPNSVENILNKSHYNTNEKIIRKNLLFSEGDNISPLILSDNERILRQLPYIDDSRIIVMPVNDYEADIIILTKDVYSLGGSYVYNGLKKGSVSLFEKNIFGMGHEFGIDIPFDSKAADSPGFGVHYKEDNIAKTFINLNVFYLNGLGEKTYGFDLSRKLVSATTKYAGGLSVRQMYTSEDLDTMMVPAPLKYNLQDYWVSRSFLLNAQSISRLIFGLRYTNNNVFDHPVILPESFHNLQKYKFFLGSAVYSIQKYAKTNLIYGYGRTEDIPYGGMIRITAGREFNEFKQRTYISGEASAGWSYKAIGYFYTRAGYSTFLNKDMTEQGLLNVEVNLFSNLVNLGTLKIRNFLYFNYLRGFGRYSNEYLKFYEKNGFSGFKNDSVTGNQRLSVSLETVLFSPINKYGFRIALFGFTDFSFLSGTNEILGRGYALSSIGLGIRIRNDNLVFNTLQIRIGYFPNPPAFSKISPLTISGEQLLRPDNFESGPPTVIPYH